MRLRLSISGNIQSNETSSIAIQVNVRLGPNILFSISEALNSGPQDVPWSTIRELYWDSLTQGIEVTNVGGDIRGGSPLASVAAQTDIQITMTAQCLIGVFTNPADSVSIKQFKLELI
jgi:hypothetical protein